MKKYLVKKVSTGTPSNPNFAGEGRVSWHGKGNEFWCEEDCMYYFDYFLLEYGYNSEAAARRNWSYRNPENTKYWSSTVEIVCFEV